MADDDIGFAGVAIGEDDVDGNPDLLAETSLFVVLFKLFMAWIVSFGETAVLLFFSVTVAPLTVLYILVESTFLESIDAVVPPPPPANEVRFVLLVVLVSSSDLNNPFNPKIIPSPKAPISVGAFDISICTPLVIHLDVITSNPFIQVSTRLSMIDLNPFIIPSKPLFGPSNGASLPNHFFTIPNELSKAFLIGFTIPDTKPPVYSPLSFFVPNNAGPILSLINGNTV